jgi:uncharacterized protein
LQKKITNQQTMQLSDIVIYPIKSLRGVSVPRIAVEREGLAFDRRWMLIREDTRRFITQREVPQLCLFQPELTPLDLPSLGTRQGSRQPGAALVVKPPARSSLPPLTVALADDDDGRSSRRAVVDATVWGFSGDALDEGDEAAEWFTAALAELRGGGGQRPAAPAARVRLVKHDPRLPRGRRVVDPSFALPGTTTAFSDEYPVLAATDGSLADLNARVRRRQQQGEEAPPLPMSRFRPNLIFAGAEASQVPWADDAWARVRVGGGVEFEYVKPCSRCKVTTVDPATGEIGAAGSGCGAVGDQEPLRTLRGFRTGAALGWDKKRPAFKHAVFFAWNVQPVGLAVAAPEAEQQAGRGGAAAAAEASPPLAVLERGGPVEVVARRAWE